MKLALIGMPNSGKSHWSKELKTAGYVSFDCDNRIEQKLEPELRRLGYAGLNDMALWMGQPFEPQYAANSKRYLELEREVMLEVLAEFDKLSQTEQNVYLDTTGSVIYTGTDVLAQLKERLTIVYLETPKAVQEQMYKEYLANPKPVIWQNNFRQLKGQSNMEALARSYGLLLQSRTRHYEHYADVTMDYHQLRAPGFSLEDFLPLVEANT
jgi:shikimate kinase